MLPTALLSLLFYQLILISVFHFSLSFSYFLSLLAIVHCIKVKKKKKKSSPRQICTKIYSESPTCRICLEPMVVANPSLIPKGQLNNLTIGNIYIYTVCLHLLIFSYPSLVLVSPVLTYFVCLYITALHTLHVFKTYAKMY